MKVAVQAFCSFTVVFGGHGPRFAVPQIKESNRLVQINRVIIHVLKEETILQGSTSISFIIFHESNSDLTQYYGTLCLIVSEKRPLSVPVHPHLD